MELDVCKYFAASFNFKLFQGTKDKQAYAVLSFLARYEICQYNTPPFPELYENALDSQLAGVKKRLIVKNTV